MSVVLFLHDLFLFFFLSFDRQDGKKNINIRNMRDYVIRTGIFFMGLAIEIRWDGVDMSGDLARIFWSFSQNHYGNLNMVSTSQSTQCFIKQRIM